MAVERQPGVSKGTILSTNRSEPAVDRPLNEFCFVEGLNKKSYTKTVRAHVLRSHIQHRRTRAGAKGVFRLQGESSRPKRLAAATGPSTSQDLIQELDSDEENKPAFAPGRPEQPVHAPGTVQVYHSRPQLPSPVVAGIGSGRVDPFNSYARPVTVQEQYLVDFYTGDLIQYHGSSNHHGFHPPRHICFSTNIQALAPMEVMFFYALRHRQLRLHDVPEKDLWTYRLAAVSAINSAVSDPRLQFADTTLMAVCGLVCSDIELKPHDRDEDQSTYHLKGLRKLVELHGGFPALINVAGISWLLHWIDILTCGQISAGQTPLSVHAFSPPSALQLTGQPNLLIPSYDDIPMLAEEFVGVYGNLFHEAQVRHESSQAYTPPLRDGFPIHMLFRRGAPIYRLLTAPQALLAAPNSAALFYLNFVLWDYSPYRHPSLSSIPLHAYFQSLRHIMVDEGLDVTGTLDFFMWVLITDFSGTTRRIEDGPRVWLLARMLRVNSLLSAPLQARIAEALLWFLTADDNDLEHPILDPAQLRRQLMHDLALEGV